MSFGCWSYWSYEEDMIVLMIGHVFWKHDPCHNGNHKKHETLQNQITSWSHTPQQGHLLSVVGLILQSCISTLHFATLHKITRWSHTPQEGHFLSVPQQPITASSSAETLTDNTITAPGTPTLQPTTPTIPPYQKEIRFGDTITNRSQNRFLLTGLGSVRTHQIPMSSLRWLVKHHKSHQYDLIHRANTYIIKIFTLISELLSTELEMCWFYIWTLPK